MTMENIIINTLAIAGLYAVSMDGFLLAVLRRFIQGTPIINIISKPLISCALCMSSIWGAMYYLFHGSYWFDFVFHILSVAGAMYILTNVVALVKQATTYLDIKKLLGGDKE